MGKSAPRKISEILLIQKMTTAERGVLKCFLLYVNVPFNFPRTAILFQKLSFFPKSSFLFSGTAVLYSRFFFDSCLANLRPNLGHHRRNSFTNPKLITAFFCYEHHRESPGVPFCFPEVPF